MSDKRRLAQKRLDQMLFGALAIGVALQLLIAASDEQYVTNLAKPKLGAYNIGLWHSSLGFSLYTFFAYTVVVLIAISIAIATLRAKRVALATISFGTLFYGALFGNVLPFVEQNLWAWGGFIAAGLFLVTLLSDFFGGYVRRSVPRDTSELTSREPADALRRFE